MLMLSLELLIPLSKTLSAVALKLVWLEALTCLGLCASSFFGSEYIALSLALQFSKGILWQSVLSIICLCSVLSDKTLPAFPQVSSDRSE